MERTTQILVGVVVLGALGGALYKMSKDDATSGGTTTTSSADLPEISASDDIDKISIVNGDKSEVVLEKKSDKWELSKPVSALANQANVTQLLDSMKKLKTTDVVSAAPSEDQKKELQLGKDKALHLVAWKGAEKRVDASFGKSGARGQTVAVDGKPGIYTAAGYTSSLYAREANAWRDTEIFKLDDANAAQVSIANRNGAFSFVKTDGWAGSFMGKPIADFDPQRVDELLRALDALNAQDFGDGKSPADVGLDSPEATVTIDAKDGAGKHVLKVGKIANGMSRYAQKDGDPTIFVVSPLAATWALADPSRFQKAKDAGAADAGAGAAGLPGMRLRPDVHVSPGTQVPQNVRTPQPAAPQAH